jgi:hypothetical protein
MFLEVKFGDSPYVTSMAAILMMLSLFLAIAWTTNRVKLPIGRA